MSKVQFQTYNGQWCISLYLILMFVYLTALQMTKLYIVGRCYNYGWILEKFQSQMLDNLLFCVSLFFCSFSFTLYHGQRVDCKAKLYNWSWRCYQSPNTNRSNCSTTISFNCSILWTWWYCSSCSVLDSTCIFTMLLMSPLGIGKALFRTSWAWRWTCPTFDWLSRNAWWCCFD